MDASLEWCSTPPLWHTKAVGGRPPCTFRRCLVAVSWPGGPARWEQPASTPVPPARAGGGLLQSKRHGGAVDPRRQKRREVDTPVVSLDECQCGPPPASRAGVQPGQLLSY